MFTENTNGQVINLGNPDERAIAEIATMIKTMVGVNYLSRTNPILRISRVPLL